VKKSVTKVQLGLVASLNRPGGNLTGVSILNAELGPKRLELLHEVVPAATSMALLVNPTNPGLAAQSRDLQAAARTLGLQLHILHASTERDFDTVFATLAQTRTGGLESFLDPPASASAACCRSGQRSLPSLPPPSHPRASKHHMRPNHPGNAWPAQLSDVVSHPRTRPSHCCERRVSLTSTEHRMLAGAPG